MWLFIQAIVSTICSVYRLIISLLFIGYCLTHLCKHCYLQPLSSPHLSKCHNIMLSGFLLIQQDLVATTGSYILLCYFIFWFECLFILTALHLLGRLSPPLLFKHHLFCYHMCPFLQTLSDHIVWQESVSTNLACHLSMMQSYSSVHHAGGFLHWYGSSWYVIASL